MSSWNVTLEGNKSLSMKLSREDEDGDILKEEKSETRIDFCHQRNNRNGLRGLSQLETIVNQFKLNTSYIPLKRQSTGMKINWNDN